VITGSELNDQLATNTTTLVDRDEVLPEWVMHQITLQKVIKKIGATYAIF